jgi:hypothetical protein
VRLSEISPSQRRLLSELASRISDRLEAHFVELPRANDTHIGIALHEGERKVVIEVPLAVLVQATEDLNGREILRTRMKARRDRMMFVTPPRRLPKEIAPLFNPGPGRGGGGFRGGRR